MHLANFRSQWIFRIFSPKGPSFQQFPTHQNVLFCFCIRKTCHLKTTARCQLPKKKAPRNRYHGPMRLHVTALLVVPTWSIWGPGNSRVGWSHGQAELGWDWWNSLVYFFHRKKRPYHWTKTIVVSTCFNRSTISLSNLLTYNLFKASWRNSFLEDLRRTNLFRIRAPLANAPAPCCKATTLPSWHFPRPETAQFVGKCAPGVFVTISWAGQNHGTKHEIQ